LTRPGQEGAVKTNRNGLNKPCSGHIVLAANVGLQPYTLNTLADLDTQLLTPLSDVTEAGPCLSASNVLCPTYNQPSQPDPTCKPRPPLTQTLLWGDSARKATEYAWIAAAIQLCVGTD